MARRASGSPCDDALQPGSSFSTPSAKGAGPLPPPPRTSRKAPFASLRTSLTTFPTAEGKRSVKHRLGSAKAWAAVAAFARCAALFRKNFCLYRGSSAEDPTEDVADCSTVTEDV